MAHSTRTKKGRGAAGAAHQDEIRDFDVDESGRTAAAEGGDDDLLAGDEDEEEFDDEDVADEDEEFQEEIERSR